MLSRTSASVAALDVADKSQRVARYQRQTITSFLELVGVGGLTHPAQIGPQHVFRRIDDLSIKSLDAIYPQVEPGSYLESGGGPPMLWRRAWQASSAASFQ